MQLGDFNLHIISAGSWWLDGGSVFGVVPRNLWGQLAAPDEQNRVQLGLNCLLVQTGEANILVDCGVGTKLSARLRQIYGVQGDEGFLERLGRYCAPQDINYLVLSHLHFDHAGGASYYEASGQLQLTFPQAQIVAQTAEWEAANSPSIRTKGSYLTENIQPLKQSLRLVGGDVRLMEGIELIFTNGHSAGHQMVKVTSQGQTALYMGDIAPTVAHLQLPYITAFDILPEKTLMIKDAWLRRAIGEQYLVIFAHDANVAAGYLTLQQDKGNFKYLVNPVNL